MVATRSRGNRKSMSSRRGGADSLEEDVDSTTERSRRPRIHLDSPEMRARAKKIILQCCDEIDSLPLDPKTGKVYRGSAQKVMNEFLAFNPWLTIDMIKSKRKRRKKTAQTLSASGKNDQGNNAPQIDLENMKPVAKAGRKKGTTNAAITESKRRFMDMKNRIVKVWANKETRPKCTLDKWIETNKRLFGFNTGKLEHHVSKAMVYTRMKRNQVENKGRKGQYTPLHSIEPRLVMFVKLASDCNQEMTQDEILRFVNSYIQGSQLEQKIIDWKLRNVGDWRNAYIQTGIRPSKANIQAGWFAGFVRRWKDEISYSKSKNTAHYRKEHCTYANFDLMYDKIYSLLEEGGYAEKLPVPILCDKLGNPCDDKSSAFGKPVELSFTRPEFVLCADECGTNTNMANDRLSGGNKRLHSIGTSVTLPGCTSDVHFTTMGFAALDGRPVCCVVIIQKTGALNLGKQFGFDVKAKWNGDLSVFRDYEERIRQQSEQKDDDKKKPSELPEISASLLAANMGPGKAFPGGPVCEFNGKKIPSYVTSSESGGITPEILVSVLKHLDKHGVTNRGEGDPPPCLIVDGHGSRLSIPFLRYINNLDADGKTEQGANHRWKVYIGLPNGTAYWQIADSSYINGRFKLQMRKQKETTRDTQKDNNEAIQIKRYDVVVMIRNCWSTCFGDVEGNKKAIVSRGWNPLNKACLVMPDIAKTRPKDAPKSNQSIEAQTNTDDRWCCAAQDLCGLGNAAFTDKDTHRCKTCRKRIHGILCCVRQTEDEEGTGPMYCKKCGRPGGDSSQSVSADSSVSVGTSGTSGLKRFRSEVLEEQFSQDPDHCSDMNPSGQPVVDVISKIQLSKRRNIGNEKKMMEIKRLVAEERSNNRLMGLLASRVTAGSLASVGQHDISQPQVLGLMEAKEDRKQSAEDLRTDKKFDKELKIYHDGIEALAKEKLYEVVLNEIGNAPDKTTATAIQKAAKKDKKLMLAGDFLSLIRYKELGLRIELRNKIPTNMKRRKEVWYATYKGLPHPDKPVMPEGYERRKRIEAERVEADRVSAEDNTGGDLDDNVVGI